MKDTTTTATCDVADSNREEAADDDEPTPAGSAVNIDNEKEDYKVKRLESAPDSSDSNVASISFSDTDVKAVNMTHILREITDLLARHDAKGIQQEIMHIFEKEATTSTTRAERERRKKMIDSYTADTDHGPSKNDLEIGVLQPSPAPTDLQRHRPATSSVGAFDVVSSGEVLTVTRASANQPQGNPNQVEVLEQEHTEGRPDSGIAVAHAITGELAEDDQRPLVVAERMGFLSKWQKPILACAGIAVLAAIVVGVSCAATDACFDREPATLAPTLPPTASPTMAPTANVLGELSASTLDALEDPISYQSRAYQWLLDDPNLNTYSVERLRQRFALAVLMIATDSRSANLISDGGNLTSYDTDECEWWSGNETEIEARHPEYPGGPCVGDHQYRYLIPLGYELSGEIPPELGILT